MSGNSRNGPSNPINNDSPPRPDKGSPPSPAQPSGLPGFWKELKRRHVVRVAITYAVVAWLVIQIAASTFGWFDIPKWAFRLVVFMIVLGFPLSLVVAWAFELTPEGIKTSKTAREVHPESHKDESHAKKRHWFSLGLAAAIPTLIFSILALVFYIRSGGDGQTFDGEKSIAVLPFENLSQREEDEAFTNGIHSDLLTQISHIRNIRPISRTSVMTYLGSDKKLREIAEELGVATILNGGVQRAANEIRINVQLIDAATDASLWGETYTRDLTADNIFKIQSEISRAIANALQAVLSPEEQEQLDKLPTTDLAALEAYFKGVTASSPETAENIAEAVAHYQRAIELDPAFALAYARLARDYLVQVNYGFSTEDQIAMAQPLVDKALELDPQLSEAYDALGILRRYQLDFAGSEAAYQRAIELNPNNAIAYRGYSVLLRNYSADPEKSLVMARKARELNPDTPIWKAGEAVALRDLGHMNESRALLKTLVRDHPDYSQGYDWLGTTYRDDFGLHDQAIVAFRRAHALDPRFPWPPLDIAMTYERLGAREEEIFWLERTLALAPEDRFALRHRVRLLIIKGELAEADALWWREWRPSATPPWAVNNSWELEDLMNAEFAAGRFDASRARFFKRFPDWFEPDAVIPDDRQGLFSVRNVARALIATGEQQQADYLLDQIIEKLDASPESTNTLYLRAVVPAIKDDHAEAMRAIHRYVAFAGVPSDNLYSDAEFHPLYSNPEFQAVFGDVEGKRKKQLEHIRAMKANGELAPIPPLPGK